MSDKEERDREQREAPWSLDVGPPVFASIWSTGPDPTTDGALRLQALRRNADGTWERFDRYADPFPDRSSSLSAAGRRAIREFGVRTEDLEGQPSASELMPAFLNFIGEDTVVVADRAEFEAWTAHLSGDPDSSLGVVGISDTAALLLPGRLANRRAELVHDLLPPQAGERASARAVLPEDVQAALTELLRRYFACTEGVLAVAAHGYTRAWEGLAGSDPEAARCLARTLRLVERPGHFRESAAGNLPLGPELPSGAMSRALALDIDWDDLAHMLEPRWAAEGDAWMKHKPLPAKPEGELSFPPEDLERLDDIFQVHLSAIFGVEPDEGYRPAQHDVAREVAGTLGIERAEEGGPAELLLVHAPTGTGKTIAYLVPLLLWSHRHKMRSAVATYTRALQEQAFDSDVPRALAALRRAGLEEDLRVALLKGRENYVCWRSARLQSPAEEASGAEWLTWTRFLLFSAVDNEGDLDRLPQTAPLPTSNRKDWQRADRSLRDRVRARSGCCRFKEDRRTCASHVSRARAERSHVVITNQAFALTNPNFAAHLVFDECEHLHDQADSVFGHGISLRGIERLFERLSSASGGRGVFDRAARVARAGSKARKTAAQGVGEVADARALLSLLTRAVEEFLKWKTEAEREREERDCHSLMREFVNNGDAAGLIRARDGMNNGLSAIESTICELSEHLDGVAGAKSARLRRRLDLLRVDIVDARGAVAAWIPTTEGSPNFHEARFYDAAEASNGDVELAARVLLPNELLGEHYYPSLATAVFVSATTWLKGGFDCARFYLGLDHAETTTEEGGGAPLARVHTHRSPEAFDYERVLVCAPKDVPNPRDLAAHLSHVRRYIAYLGERTRGRILALFTNAEHVKKVGAELEGFFRARAIPLWYQGMEGVGKEELSELFRRTTDSVLLGVDTFWYGADFPGETLEHLVITKLPFGVPDRYHHAQCAALSQGEQWKKIYMPRALSKFRQGFGRLMRRESDRGVVHILDPRILNPRQRIFQKELPIHNEFTDEDPDGLARFIRADTDRCLRESLAHMELLADVERRGQSLSFANFQPSAEEPDDVLVPFPQDLHQATDESESWSEEVLPWAHEEPNS
ncbi:MAG: hypothetical protein MK297_07500 [Planctomycetes bacterium]|nr:hypothetical protein [Planctomycetota bacterium]